MGQNQCRHGASFFRSRHELIAVFKVRERHRTSIASNSAQYGTLTAPTSGLIRCNGFGAGRDAGARDASDRQAGGAVADAIRDCSKRNGLILDPFFGSGTTVIAAETTGRRAAAFKLDPRYVDTIIRHGSR